MKFDELKQQLDEVRMASSNLNQFLNSPRAADMRSGFEAELIFRGMGEIDYDNAEYVNDYSYDSTTNDIDRIIRFFSENMDSRDLEHLRESLYDDYLEWRDQQTIDDFGHRENVLVKEWLEENGWDPEEMMNVYLNEEMGLSEKEVEAAQEAGQKYASKITSSKQQREIREADKDYDNYLTAMDAVDEKLDELVQEEIDDHGDAWQGAFDEFSEDSDYDERSWLRSAGLRNMSDIEENYTAYWPHLMPDEDSVTGGYSYSQAETLAASLEQDLGVDTDVSSSYHGQTKDETSWYFEPDGSLKPDDDDDMPVEIVSPPMALKDTHAILPRFFAWVESNNGYANKSTGFHMSLSMPGHSEQTIDKLKLALFLGDEYVLESFGREANSYCESSLKIIRKRLVNSDPTSTAADLSKAFDHMRKNLIHLASTAISTHGQGKFVTIHIKENYIEFRSAGGSNYFGDINKVQDTMLRYAYAMSIASDPQAEREEYAKKLYKFLSATVQNGGDAMKYFIQYSAGKLPRSALMSFVKQARQEREKAKQAPIGDANDAAMNAEETGSQDWEIINTLNGNARVGQLRAISRDHAYNQALVLARRLSSNPDLVRLPSWWNLRQI